MCQPSDGELLHSVQARTLALMGTQTAGRARRHLLGTEQLSIGILLPRNVRRFIANIPPVAGFSEERALEASLYPVLFPFLVPGCRERLINRILDDYRGGPPVRFSHHSSEMARLKYCVLCAREDRAFGRPQIWRTLPQHPAVACCCRHRVRLIPIAPTWIDETSIFDPGFWINLECVDITQAGEGELWLAQQMEWLMKVKPVDIVPQQLRDALRNALSRDYRGQRGKSLCAQKIGDAIKSAWPASESRILERETTSSLTAPLYDLGNFPAQRYAFLARAAGYGFPELFAAATQMPVDQNRPRRRAVVGRRTGRRIAAGRDEILRDRAIGGYNKLVAEVTAGWAQPIRKSGILGRAYIRSVRSPHALARLPLTSALLKSLSDTEENYASRRCSLLAKTLVAEGRTLSFPQFCRSISFGNAVKKLPSTLLHLHASWEFHHSPLGTLHLREEVVPETGAVCCPLPPRRR